MSLTLGPLFLYCGSDTWDNTPPWGGFCCYLRLRWCQRYSWGLSLKNTRPLFAERNGFVRTLLRAGRWRLVVIRPEGKGGSK